MKKYSLLLIALLLCMGLFADIIIGDRYTGSYWPFDSTVGYGKAATLYLASEIEATGNITHLSWEVWTVGQYSVDTPVKIYITTTNAIGLSEATWEDYAAGLTPVYEGIARFDQLGWYTFDITDFYYDYNTDGNLLILTEQNMGGSGILPNQPFFACHLSSGVDGLVYWQASNTPTTGTGTAFFTIRPDIRIHGISVSYVPSPATLGGPADGSTGTGILLNLTWTPGTGSPSGYDLYFGEEEPVEGNYVMSHEEMTGLSWSPGVLNFGSTYYWKVVPWNVNGHPEFELCPTWSFTTQDDTTQPIPYFQDFESANTLADINWIGAMQIADGMGANGSRGLYRWLQWGNIIYTTVQTNPIGPIDTDIELKFDYLLAYGDWMATPTTPISLGANDKIEIQVSNDFGQTFTTVYTINSSNHVESADFQNKTINLSEFTSGYVIIKFFGTFYDMYNLDYDDYLCYDNVRIQEVDTIPSFSYTPTSLNYNYVQIDSQSEAKNVKVSNLGGGEINLNAGDFTLIGANADEFAISTANLPVSLRASEFVMIPVYATPHSTGAKNANLRIAFDGNYYDVALAAEGIPAGAVVVGIENQKLNVPVDPWYYYNYSQSIYLASEIDFDATGYRIEKIAYYWNGGAGANSGDWDIYIGHTALNNFSGSSSWVPVGQLAHVYSGNIGIPNTAGWVEITLDTPFIYNGSSNILVAIDENNPGRDGSSQHFRASSSSTRRTLHYRHNTTDPDPLSPPNSNNTLNGYPNIMFTFMEIPNYPVFSINPESWDFGEWFVNIPITKEFVIRNNGNGALQINSITIQGEGFSLVQNPAPATLNLLETTSFTVQYLPTSLSNYQGSVSVNHGDGSFTVNLSGASHDPSIRIFPHTENFDGVWEGTPAAPENWKVVNADNDSYTWKRANTYITPTHSEPYAAHGSGNQNDWLISPPIDMSNHHLRMKWWDKVEGASQTSSYKVYVSTTTNQPSAFTELLGDFTCNNTTWTEHSLNLAGYHGQTIFVAFHQYHSYSSSWGFGIDDFTLEAMPTEPIFSYSPQSLSFGLVPHGVASEAQNVIISNLGVNPINVAVDDISLLGPNASEFSFSTANLPASLGAMQSVLIPVQVTAQSVGSISATLRIMYQGNQYDVALSANGLADGTVIVGDGNSNLYMPVNAYYVYSYSQTIYPQSELNISNRRIERLSYYWNGAGPGDSSDLWTIYMGHTSLGSFGSTSSWIPTSQMSQVFSGSVDIPALPGWIEVWLDEPFIYNNEDNLVIAVDQNRPGWNGNSQFFFNTVTTGNNRSIRYQSDSLNPDPASPPTGILVAGYPNTWFVFSDIPTTPVLSYTPESLFFGNNFQNEPSDWQNVTIRNSGIGTLELSASDLSIIGSSASMFELDTAAMPFSLATGQTGVFRVRFTATDAGTRTATLRMVYNGINHDIALSANAYPDGMFIIGTGTAAQRQPFGSYFGYERSAALYKASEIGRYGNLEIVSWNVAEVNPNYIPYKIYAGASSADQLTAETWAELTARLSLVHEGVHQFGELGWHSFFLNNPIPLSGENLILAVETNMGGSGAGNYNSFSYTTSAANSHMFWQQDNSMPSTAGNLNELRPNIMLSVGAAAEGLPAAPVLSLPANGATGISTQGFDLKWIPDVINGGVPDSYVLYMADSAAQIYNQLSFTTAINRFNPVLDGNLDFEYEDVWYWTVKAVNSFGESAIPDAHWFEMEADPRAILPFTEDFGSSSAWPLDWTQTYSGGLSTNGWSKSNTNYSGGTAYEMILNWQSGVGISRLITPAINTENVSTLQIDFNHFFYEYDLGSTGKVQYSHDLVNWYDTGWSFESDDATQFGTISLTVTGLNANTTYVAWTMDGDHYQFYYWYIDDVQISEPAAAIDAPQISIAQNEMNQTVLSWVAIPTALAYKVYATSDPYLETGWTLLETVNNTSYVYTGDEAKLFFKVSASTEARSTRGASPRIKPFHPRGTPKR